MVSTESFCSESSSESFSIAYMQIILPSREPARILEQFPHEISTTVFVLIKNVNFIVEYVQKKFYFSKIGQTNRLFYHALQFIF